MSIDLKIKIIPYWKNDSIVFIDYELSARDLKVTVDQPALCRTDDAFGGLCPFKIRN